MNVMRHPLALLFILAAVSVAAGCGVFDPPATGTGARTAQLTMPAGFIDRLTSP